MDGRSEEYILARHGRGSTYRLMTRKSRRVAFSRDVKLDDQEVKKHYFVYMTSRTIIHRSTSSTTIKKTYKHLRLNLKKRENLFFQDFEAEKILKSCVAVTKSARVQAMREAREEKQDAWDDLSEIQTYSDRFSHLGYAEGESFQACPNMFA